MTTIDAQLAYQTIARNLREFGYPGVSGKMIHEVHEAMKAGASIPHDIVGMFAKRQLEELEDEGGAFA